jgi:hypothetical protein
VLERPREVGRSIVAAKLGAASRGCDAQRAIEPDEDSSVAAPRVGFATCAELDRPEHAGGVLRLHTHVSSIRGGGSAEDVGHGHAAIRLEREGLPGSQAADSVVERGPGHRLRLPIEDEAGAVQERGVRLGQLEIGRSGHG